MRIGTTMDWLQNNTVHRRSSECKIRDFCNVGFAYGLTHLQGNDGFRATSAQIRVIKAFPKISGYVSANVRRGKYEGPFGLNSWENSWGVRYDHGFSIHSFYIGYQRDYGFNKENHFGHEHVVSFGWTLTFPSSIFLGLFGSYK